MTDPRETAPERVWLDWPDANRVEAVYDEPPARPDDPCQTKYVRADLHEAALAENARLRAAIHEASHPDFLWGALDNVHDAETTLDDYAAAASRAIRAALGAGE